MRTASALVCVSVPVLFGGAIGAGCINNDAAPAGGADAGLLFDGAPSLDGTVGALSSASVDFGQVGCGSGTANRTYTIRNTTSSSITYTASIATGSVFSILGASGGTVVPGETGSLTLVVTAIPTTSPAGTPLTLTLHLTTDIPGLAAVDVPLEVTPRGGALVISPALVGFGQVQIGSSAAPIPLTISNVGNAPVTLSFGGATDDGGATDPAFGVFYAGSPGPTTIAAGGVAGAGATFLPTAPGARTVSLPIKTGDPLCASAAGALAMSGTGTSAKVTVGPDPLQFGTVPCGQAGTPLQVTITNSSHSAVAFTDSLGMGASSPFTVDVTYGTVPASGASAGTAVITVTPKTIPVPGSIAAGAFNDTLVVKPSAAFVAPTTITLQESASGAILALSMGGDGGTGFGTVGQNQAPSLPFTVVNTGNVDAPVTAVVTGAGYDAGFLSPPATATAGGGAASGIVTFAPVTSGAVPGSLTVSTTAPCGSVVPSIALTATGAIPVASFPGTPIAVGATCGGGIGTQGSVQITNTGGSPLTISGAASTSGKFTIVSSPATIAAGSSDVITIQAVAIGQGTAGGSTVDDTLTFTTNEPGSPLRSVPVALAVSGANLVYVGAPNDTIAFNTAACGQQLYSVSNTGNLSATVTATGTYPNDLDDNGDSQTVFRFGGTFSSPTVIAAGTQVGDTVQIGIGQCANVSCALTGSQAFTSEISGSAVGICIPLPTLDLTLAYCNCFTGGC